MSTALATHHRPSMSPSLPLPLEIWELIIQSVLTHPDSFLGPPAGLTDLCLISPSLYANILHFDTNPRLYARLFLFKFDHIAVRKRLGIAWISAKCLALEFQKRIQTMRRVRRGVRSNQELNVDDLWTCYLMMLENDGRNERQLEWSNLYGYIRSVTIIRCNPAVPSSFLWFEDAEVTALTLWLFWMIVPEGTLQTHDAEQYRAWFVTKCLPLLIFQGYMFPSAHAPDSIYNPDAYLRYDGLPSCSGPLPRTRTIIHYSRPIHFCAPLVTPIALLLYTTRSQLYAPPMDPSAFHGPVDRASAPSGYVGPTLQDIAEFTSLRISSPERCLLTMETNFDWNQDDEDSVGDDDNDEEDENNGGEEEASHLPKAWPLVGSRRYDQEWCRTASLGDPSGDRFIGAFYLPGSIAGTWTGNHVLTNFGLFNEALRQGGLLPPNTYVEMPKKPLSFEMKEHHCLFPNRPLQHTNSFLNAWMPAGTVIDHVQDGIKVFDPTENCSVRYDTYLPEGSGPGCPSYARAAIEMLRNSGILETSTTIEYEVADETESFTEDEVDPDGLNEIVGFEEVETIIARRSQSLSGASYSRDYGFDDRGLSNDGSDDEDSSDSISDHEGSVGSANDDEEDEYVEYVQHKHNGIRDIILTGSSSEEHGLAWGFFDYVGRVRPWDGLIVLVRTPRTSNPSHRDSGRLVFRGHIFNDKFVGRWRETATPANQIGFEGGFIVQRTC